MSRKHELERAASGSRPAGNAANGMSEGWTVETMIVSGATNAAGPASSSRTAFQFVLRLLNDRVFQDTLYRALNGV